MITNEIITDKTGNFLVRGVLDFSSAPIIEREGCKLINESMNPVFDLQCVTSHDNTALAVLTSWMRYAKRMQKIIHFKLSPQLFDMAKVSNLTNILPIEANE